MMNKQDYMFDKKLNRKQLESHLCGVFCDDVGFLACALLALDFY